MEPLKLSAPSSAQGKSSPTLTKPEGGENRTSRGRRAPTLPGFPQCQARKPVGAPRL